MKQLACLSIGILIAAITFVSSLDAQMISRSKKRFGKQGQLPNQEEKQGEKQERKPSDPGQRKADGPVLQKKEGLNQERTEQSQTLPDSQLKLNHQDSDKKLEPEKTYPNTDLELSVSEPGRQESLKVKFDRGVGNVVYSTTEKGKSKVNRYKVKSIQELAEKNERAFELYKNHMDAMQQVEGAPGAGGADGVFNFRFGNGSAIQPGSSGSRSLPRMQGQAAFSGAWQRASSVNNNGRIRNSKASGTFGNGAVGGQALTPQMRQKINQMLQQTRDPQTRRMLQEMLRQGK